MIGMTKKMMMKMIGNFETLYERQMQFQQFIEGMAAGNKLPALPHDNHTLFHYHITAMIEELGEVLKVDKRWKTHRNTNYNKGEKLDEISDCFITLMNVSMWSGYSSNQILEAIEHKIEVNEKRVLKNIFDKLR